MSAVHLLNVADIPACLPPDTHQCRTSLFFPRILVIVPAILSGCFALALYDTRIIAWFCLFLNTNNINLKLVHIAIVEQISKTMFGHKPKHTDL